MSTENLEHWNALAEWLAEKSANTCTLNGCTENEHLCDSYAYIDANASCHDVCASDYWQGQTYPIAAIPLPWNGDGEKLRDAVLADIE